MKEFFMEIIEIIGKVAKIDFSKVSPKDKKTYRFFIFVTFMSYLLIICNSLDSFNAKSSKRNFSYARKDTTIKNESDSANIPTHINSQNFFSKLGLSPDLIDTIIVEKYDTPTIDRWFCIVYFKYDSMRKILTFNGFNFNKLGEVTYRWTTEYSTFNENTFTYYYKGSYVGKLHGETPPGVGHVYFDQKNDFPSTGCFGDQNARRICVQFVCIGEYIPFYNPDISSTPLKNLDTLGKALTNLIYS